jgi:hypothetical protein
MNESTYFYSSIAKHPKLTVYEKVPSTLPPNYRCNFSYR